MNLNKAIIVGRVTDKPELRVLPSGTSVCTFSVATNRIWIDKKTNQKKRETEFHNIVCWGQIAEVAGRYLQKGSLVLVEGRLRTRKWEKNGQTFSRTEIIAESLQLGPKPAPAPSEGESEKELKPEEIIPIIEESEDINLPEEELPF